MSDELRNILSKKLDKVEGKWEKIFDQEMQQKINTLMAQINKLGKTFKEDVKKFKEGDA